MSAPILLENGDTLIMEDHRIRVLELESGSGIILSQEALPMLLEERRVRYLELEQASGQ